MSIADLLTSNGGPVHLPRPYTTALAWAVAAELCALSDDLVVLELHPADGQYDCLSVYTRARRLVCHMNLTGSLTHASWFNEASERLGWPDVARVGPRRAALAIAEAERLTPRTAELSPMALTARALADIAAALSMRDDTAILSAVDDSSYGAGPRDGLVAPFASVCDDLGIDSDADAGSGGYRWWFVTRGHTRPVACVDAATARVWLDPAAPLELATLPAANLVGSVLAALEQV